MTADKPAISVVIPSCNGERHIPACLESLQRQTLREFETIVVENGSEDRTAEIVSREFPWVKLTSLGAKQGFSRPVNIGWRHAAADLVFLLNDDTVCADDCLQRLVAAAEANLEYGFFAACMVYFEDPDVINSAGHRLLRDGTVVDSGQGSGREGYFGTQREVFGACAGAAVYRRDLLEQLDGMDEDFWIINEDVDLDFRAQLAGYRCLYVPEAVVQHRVSQFMGAGSPRMQHAYVKNLGLYMIKDFPPAFWRDLRFEILLHAWKASSALVREGHVGVLARARWDQVKLGARMVRKRRALAEQFAANGHIIREWADRDVPPQGPATPQPPRKPWLNIIPALVSGVLLAPLLFWLGCAAIQDWLLVRSTHGSK